VVNAAPERCAGYFLTKVRQKVGTEKSLAFSTVFTNLESRILNFFRCSGHELIRTTPFAPGTTINTAAVGSEHPRIREERTLFLADRAYMTAARAFCQEQTAALFTDWTDLRQPPSWLSYLHFAIYELASRV
jgi:hypothetical protein